MDESVNLNNAWLFAAHAKKDVAIWKMAAGQQVTHTNYGNGTIMDTELNEEPNHRQIRLRVRFRENLEKTFKAEALSEARYFSDMQLPSGVPGLVLRSSKTINKGTPPMPSGLLLSAPHLRFRSTIKLLGPNPRCFLDLFCGCKGLAC
jgi:hypothetical protein